MVKDSLIGESVFILVDVVSISRCRLNDRDLFFYLTHVDIRQGEVVSFVFYVDFLKGLVDYTSCVSRSSFISFVNHSRDDGGSSVSLFDVQYRVVQQNRCRKFTFRYDRHYHHKSED